MTSAANGVVLHRLVVGALATNCWLVHAAGNRTAMLVDPGDEPERIIGAVRRLGLDVVAVVLTHAHFTGAGTPAPPPPTCSPPTRRHSPHRLTGTRGTASANR